MHDVAAKTLCPTILRELAAERECDPIPQAILLLAARRRGKQITKRDADTLTGMFPGLRAYLRRENSLSIEWCAKQTKYDPEKKQTVADRDGLALIAMGVPGDWSNRRRVVLTTRVDSTWPTRDEIKNHPSNAWAFGARDEREAARDHAVAFVTEGGASKTTLDKIAAHLDALTMLAQELNGLMGEIPEPVQRIVAREFITHTRAALEHPF